MNWKIRHEGSPRAIDGLTPDQVMTGLVEGQWATTDEVMGPMDENWIAIENHPTFAAAAEELEEPPPAHHDDETRLDMNPLIDVCLVLLIFFILTTSYAALQMVLEMPTSSTQDLKGPPIKTKAEVEKFTIKVEARQDRGKPVIRVEEETVDLDNLESALSGWAKRTKKAEILLDARGVTWDTVAKIQDAAKGAGVQRVHFQVNQDELR